MTSFGIEFQTEEEAIARENRSGPRGSILFNMFIMEEKVWMELKQTV